MSIYHFELHEAIVKFCWGKGLLIQFEVDGVMLQYASVAVVSTKTRVQDIAQFLTQVMK